MSITPYFASDLRTTYFGGLWSNLLSQDLCPAVSLWTDDSMINHISSLDLTYIKRKYAQAVYFQFILIQ